MFLIEFSFKITNINDNLLHRHINNESYKVRKTYRLHQ